MTGAHCDPQLNCYVTQTSVKAHVIPFCPVHAAITKQMLDVYAEAKVSQLEKQRQLKVPSEATVPGYGAGLGPERPKQVHEGGAAPLPSASSIGASPALVTPPPPQVGGAPASTSDFPPSPPWDASEAASAAGTGGTGVKRKHEDGDGKVDFQGEVKVPKIESGSHPKPEPGLS